MDDAGWDFSVLAQAHATTDRSPRSRVRRLVASILEDPARPHTVEELAQRAAVSPRTLSRLFRRETGTTPARFVARARLDLARALLDGCGASVEWIARRAGFCNAERMRRTFHRALGTSPRGYTSSGCGTMRR